ncbi:MBL fold metallo-hydrolase [Daejeonella lutea]|uniref:Glyoxylase, beta-lactamase superfamily II n=1 Tax=Daejeonella lutea TaxID=572036 RepID=A0A1T5AWB8_9SPHI|nr:MBL fold metallo-hydrolase [Daejeonella lutea]SKB39331.1 Glyoxylase, beta-lactamase superfamily II [Daejeonella lutea]
MKRRTFIQSAGMSIGMLALLQNKGFANLIMQAPYKMTLLRKDVGIFTEQGGTIGWMVNNEGVVVVDTQFANTAAHLIEELKKKSQKPFKYLINTHHHGDHTGGNIAFKGLAEHVIGHANCLINQRATAAAQKSEDKQLFADTVFNDQWKTKVGSQGIHAQYFGAGHTNGDAIIHFEDANIAHMGDLMFNRRFPFIDRAAGANIKSWIQVLDKAVNKFDSDTLFIFGHSLDPEKVTGKKEDLRAMQNYLEKLLLFVGNEKKAGKSKEEILKATSIPGAEDYKGQGIERSLTAAYEELSA